jgi:nitrile hydratase accessory protein
VTELVAPAVRDMEGLAALPRDNGEIVFEAPWQGRAFGLALGVVQQLGLEWEEFRRRLITAIAAEPDRPYYESWTVALEALVTERGLADRAEIDGRAADTTS